MCETIISKISSVNKTFHASTGVLPFTALPLGAGSCIVRDRLVPRCSEAEKDHLCPLLERT